MWPAIDRHGSALVLRRCRHRNNGCGCRRHRRTWLGPSSWNRAISAPIPQFEVDKAWPQKPANMKFGDVSSIAIDANGNAWVLSRPRTLKPEDKAQAAPPITIFAPDGKYIRGWGGDGQGYQWPE